MSQDKKENDYLKDSISDFDLKHLMVLNRTILALWKARSLSPEQKVQIVEEESEVKNLQTEESGSFVGLDDVSMSEVYSSALSVPVSCLSLTHKKSYICKHFIRCGLMMCGDLILFRFSTNAHAVLQKMKILQIPSKDCVCVCEQICVQEHERTQPNPWISHYFVLFSLKMV